MRVEDTCHLNRRKLEKLRKRKILLSKKHLQIVKQGERWKKRNMATKSNRTKLFEEVGDYTTTH